MKLIFWLCFIWKNGKAECWHLVLLSCICHAVCIEIIIVDIFILIPVYFFVFVLYSFGLNIWILWLILHHCYLKDYSISGWIVYLFCVVIFLFCYDVAVTVEIKIVLIWLADLSSWQFWEKDDWRHFTLSNLNVVNDSIYRY